MLIVCPNCATSYSIQAPSLGATGRTVRCARCQTQWFATPGREAVLNSFVDDVIAEAQARPSTVRAAAMPSANVARAPSPPPPAPRPPQPAPAPVVRMPSIAPMPVVQTPQPAPAPINAADEVAQFTAALDEVSAVPPMAADDIAPPTIQMDVSPPLVPPNAPADTTDAEDIEHFAARRAARQAKQRKQKGALRLPIAIFTLGLIAGAILIWRNDLVRHAPQTASLFSAIGLPVNIRGVVFEDVTVSKETQDGVTVLVIEGKLVSTSKKAADIPRLRFAVRNLSGNEIYSWTAQPPRSILGPGEQVAFRSRLASPPQDANDILVRFFTPRDLAGGGK